VRFYQHADNLPPSWGTLYELTKLDDQQFSQALASGAINPGMERKDVAALRAPQQDTSPAQPVSTAREQRLARRAVLGMFEKLSHIATAMEEFETVSVDYSPEEARLALASWRHARRSFGIFLKALGGLDNEP
jgi:hypothetical protein